MKNKVIIGVIIVFAILISIDLFIRKPWQQNGNSDEPSEAISTTLEVSEENTTDDNTNANLEDSESESSSEISPETIDVSENQYFITKNNFSSDLYLNGEFNTNKLGLYSDQIETEDLNKLYDNMDLIYDVAHGNKDVSSLKGIVDSVLLDDEYHARFNGFLDEFSKREEYSIYDSIKIGEGLYKVTILIQTPAGEGDSNYQNDAILTSAVFNSIDNRISFEEMTRRKPFDYKFEDERFKLHIYMVENYTHDSKLYISLTSKMNETIAIEDFPVIKADVVQPNGNEETIYIKIDEYGYNLANDVTFFFVVNVSITVDQIVGIEIANK